MGQFSKQHPVGYYVLQGKLPVSMMFAELSECIAGLPDVGEYTVVMEVMRPFKDATVYPIFTNKTRKEMEAARGRVLQFKHATVVETTMSILIKNIKESV